MTNPSILSGLPVRNILRTDPRHQAREDRRGHRRGQRLLSYGCPLSSADPASSSRKMSYPNICEACAIGVRDLGLQNVVISLGEPHDPRLAADSHGPTPCSTISSQRLSLVRGSALSTPSGRRPSMAPRQVCCAVSLQQWGIARSVSIGSWAARPISRSSHRHQSLAAHGRKLWSRARHHRRLRIWATGPR
jgi:hypothetical protein